jgi:hypothetical protein
MHPEAKLNSIATFFLFLCSKNSVNRRSPKAKRSLKKKLKLNKVIVENIRCKASELGIPPESGQHPRFRA